MERIFPRDLGALVEGEAQVVVGRLVGAAPTSVTVSSAAGSAAVPLQVSADRRRGDLSRRWALGRLGQLLDEGAGRAAMVDLGSRHGIITPVTSLYVPTKNEMGSEERAELDRRRRDRREKLQAAAGRSAREGRGPTEVSGRSDAKESYQNELLADGDQGGSGTRAKGEEGPMGNPGTRDTRGIQGLHLGGREAPVVVAVPTAAPSVVAPPAATAAAPGAAAAGAFRAQASPRSRSRRWAARSPGPRPPRPRAGTRRTCPPPVSRTTGSATARGQASGCSGTA